MLNIKIHPNSYSMGLELHGSPPPPQASPSMLPQSVGWTEKVAVSFHSAQWIFQKEMALWKRRPKEGKVGEGGGLQINPEIWHWRAYKHTGQTSDQRHGHPSEKFS